MSASWSQYIDFMTLKGNIEEAMIIDATDGSIWAGSANFMLQKYKASIAQEDGTDVEETVDEASNILQFIAGKKPTQGLRLNSKKYQVIRNFKEDETGGLLTLYGKVQQGGCAIVHADKCILIGTFMESKGHTSAGCYDVLRLMAGYLFKSEWPAAPAEVNWQQILSDKLVGKESIHKVMICNKEDGSVIAASEGFALRKYEAEIAQEDGTDKREVVDEAKNIAVLMTGKKPAQGLRIEEIKYQILKSFEDDHSGCYTSYGKKTKGGCCVLVTNKVILVATFDESLGHKSIGCNETLADIAKILKALGN
jgi:hypothetical protein